MMAYEKFESAWDCFGKFIYQFQPETKALLGKLERILIKLYRQNVSILFNQIYIYIYRERERNTLNCYLLIYYDVPCVGLKLFYLTVLINSPSMRVRMYVHVCVCVCFLQSCSLQTRKLIQQPLKR